MTDQLVASRGAVEFSSMQPPRPNVDATVFSAVDTELVDEDWRDVRAQIKEFAGLEDDWDGGGAVGPNIGLVNVATDLAQVLERNSQPAPDRVCVGVNGTVIFEYHMEPFMEIEVVSESLAELREDGVVVQEFSRA